MDIQFAANLCSVMALAQARGLTYNITNLHWSATDTVCLESHELTRAELPQGHAWADAPELGWGDLPYDSLSRAIEELEGYTLQLADFMDKHPNGYSEGTALEYVFHTEDGVICFSIIIATKA